jgi:hypothetical protein
MAQQGIVIEKRGALFRNPKKIVEQQTEKVVQILLEWGEEKLKSILIPRPPPGLFHTKDEALPNQFTTGNYRRNIFGKRKGITGVITDGKVVYGRWLEGVSSRNQTTRFKGYFAFRKTNHLLNQHYKKTVKHFASRYVKELNKR